MGEGRYDHTTGTERTSRISARGILESIAYTGKLECLLEEKTGDEELTAPVKSKAKINLKRVNLVVPKQIQARVNHCEICTGVDTRSDRINIAVPCTIDIVGHEVELHIIRCQRNFLHQGMNHTQSIVIAIFITSKFWRYQ